MQTRKELFKEYRDEIDKNISIDQTIKIANDKLSTLYKRLIEVFPDYEKKYPFQSVETSLSISSISERTEISSEKINQLITSVAELENKNASKDILEELTFSSGDMDEIMDSLKVGSSHGDDENKIDAHTIEMNKEPKRVNIMNSNKIRVAIDGPSGSGKSTLAKELASQLKYTYINTGLVYRSVALFCEKQKLDFTNKQNIVAELPNLTLELLSKEAVSINGEVFKDELRSDSVSQRASVVAEIPEVRTFALVIQKKYAAQTGVIMDGRDTTFNIMPDAELKIFLETSPEVRAKRRVEQNAKLGFSTDYETILAEIEERDYRDRNRETDPLQIVDDAVFIDASEMSLVEVVEFVMNIIQEKLGKK